MSRYTHVILLLLIFAATAVVLTSSVTALAREQKSQQLEQKKSTTLATKPGGATKTGGTTTNSGTATTKVKVNVKKPADSVKANREHACGNDQNKCYGLYQEMVYPHDATYPARVKVEKAYRDCMAKCIAAPSQRR